MCPEPATAKIVRKTFRNFSHRQPAGICSDDGAGLADRLDLLQQRSLEFEIFDHRFDNPIHFSKLLQIILEVADGNEAGERSIHEGGWFGFLGSLKSGGGDFVSCRRPGVGRNTCRNNIEQKAGNSGIGEVCGDAGAHGPRA